MTTESTSGTTLDLVREACPKIAGTGWLFYFTPIAQARAADLGIDVFTFYFIGRGGVLGDVEWPAVHSAFGYFNPVVIKDSWERGREKVAPRDAGRAFIECSHQFGREKLAEVEGLDALCEAMEAVNESAKLRAEGLALYAAAAAEPLADDLPARTMQLLGVLREYRGSAHLLSVVAAGLRPLEAHYIDRPEMLGLFGWSESDIPDLGEEHKERLATADDMTDHLVAPAFEVLDESGAQALREGLATVEAALSS